MPIRLDRSSADFDERFKDFLAAKREVSADVEASARAIVSDVAARGDAALIEATRKFDRLDLDARHLRVGAGDRHPGDEEEDEPTGVPREQRRLAELEVRREDPEGGDGSGDRDRRAGNGEPRKGDETAALHHASGQPPIVARVGGARRADVDERQGAFGRHHPSAP